MRLGDWAAVFTLVGATVFTVGYGALAPWWRSPIGRNMFLFSLSHMAIFGLVVTSVTFGVEWAGRPSIRAVVYLSIGLLFWQRLVILFTDQILYRRPPPEVAVALGATHRACRTCGK